MHQSTSNQNGNLPKKKFGSLEIGEKFRIEDCSYVLQRVAGNAASPEVFAGMLFSFNDVNEEVIPV